MTPVSISTAVAAEHVHDLQRAAARHRLAAAARAWIRRGHLGPGANYCAC